MKDAVVLPGLPTPLRWDVPAESWHIAEDSALTITAGARTDLFIDPQGTAEYLNAPRALGLLQGDFLLSARVTVGFESTFDAGALLLYADERLWGKLCFEYSPQAQPMVVSVVTRGLSDDANALVVSGNQVWLRVARIGLACAFHASTDGQTWQFIRHFALGQGEDLALGFLSQSPTGTGCTARFDDVRFTAERLQDLRDGT
jgi:uncharacterized protein